MLLLGTSNGQAYNTGLSKTAYSVSDAFGCSQWMLALMPTEPDTPNGAVACGEVGRVRLASAAPPAGNCTLQTGQISLVDATSADVPVAACVPSTGPDPAQEFCSVSVGFAAQGAGGTSGAVPAQQGGGGQGGGGQGGGGPTVVASTPDECCKACATNANCTGATYWPGVAAPSTVRSQGFGLHTIQVNSSTSARPAGATPNTAVESALDLILFKVFHGNGYDAFLDFTSGHWVSSLDPYTAMFDSMNLEYAMLRWADGANADRAYYSVIVRVHTSMMLLELMSARCAACTALSPKHGAHTMVMEHARYHFGPGQTPASVFGALDDADAARPLLHPARVSWPTSSLVRDRKLFVGAGLGDVLAAEATPTPFGLVQTDTYDFVTLGGGGATMQFQLVQRRPTNTTGTMSIENFEATMLSAHRSAMTSDVCGFDQWADNHFGVTAHPLGADRGNWTIGSLQRALVGLDLPYHVSESLDPGTAQRSRAVYFSAPNGLCMQVNGLADGSYVPTAPPSSMDMHNLCGVGTCSNKTT